ncbi:type II toxin-antitoxin system PemK/MazF family toxin [Patescibacteria group bacterium]|nr:type II toxin-antitoxin system PemK/MazF family toxin [Patescibacteria group bacterium]MBU1683064.1 type II toxin-antitoxin system PemK/MazF family toxin [Patescibacteria group bacterium]
MNQKDIYWANLNPSKGKEQRGKRPVVIVSGKTMVRNFDVLIVCPISSKIKNYIGCVSLKPSKLNGLKHNSEIITFQIRTVSKDRLTKKIGTITDDELKSIFQGLNDILTY